MMNKLGNDLIRGLIRSARRRRQDLLREVKTIKKLNVTTQKHHMDVCVEINDTVFLIIEDKVKTKEHSNQLIDTESVHKN